MISVIVCTYNRALLLGRLFEKLVSQTMRSSEFEIIVVIDGSTDETLEVCNNWSGKYKNIKIIQLKINSGWSAAANAALKAACGEFICYTDDDCLPNPDWIEKMQTALQSSEIVAGGIDSFASDYQALAANISEFHPFMGRGARMEVGFLAGANMGFHKSVLDKLGGFKNGCPIPDMELILRARLNGYKIDYYPDCRVLHDPKRGGLMQKLYHSSTYSSYTIQLRNEYMELLHTPFFLKNRWWLLVLSPLIAFGKTLEIFTKNPDIINYIHTLPMVFVHKLFWCKGAFQGLSKIQETEN